MKLILFGAGRNGKKLLKKYGNNKVAYFCDNDTKKTDSYIDGVKVLSFSDMINLCKKEKYCVMVTPDQCAFMVGQLEREGISDYVIYRDMKKGKAEYQISETEERHNAYLLKMVEESSRNDILEDVSKIRKISKDVLRLNKNDNVLLTIKGKYSESDYYGNLENLMKYGGVDISEKKYAPLVSHQDCMPIFTTRLQYRQAVVFSGAYYKTRIHEYYPYVPVFTVGPFINYAEGIYDKTVIAKKKEEIGKMLLVFMPHTIENVERGYSRKDFINRITRLFKSKFDTVWLCVYWADLSDPICEYAEKKGFHIVTAGFRFDNKFNSRLKTIMELADCVVCGDIGTFISYSLSMGKPVGRVDLTDNTIIGYKELKTEMERTVQFGEDYHKYESDFYDLFTETPSIDKRKLEWMNPVSGFDLIREKDYIKRIFEITKDIYLMCQGSLDSYPDAVRSVYRIYFEKLELEKMMILREAVGAFLN